MSTCEVFFDDGGVDKYLANMPESDTLSAKDHATINALLKPFAKDSLPGNVACLIQLAN